MIEYCNILRHFEYSTKNCLFTFDDYFKLLPTFLLNREYIYLFVWLRKDNNFLIRRHGYLMLSIQLLLAHKLLTGKGCRLKLVVRWDFFLLVKGLTVLFYVEQQLKFVPLLLCCFVYIFSVHVPSMCHGWISILFLFCQNI